MPLGAGAWQPDRPCRQAACSAAPALTEDSAVGECGRLFVHGNTRPAIARGSVLVWPSPPGARASLKSAVRYIHIRASWSRVIRAAQLG